MKSFKKITAIALTFAMLVTSMITTVGFAASITFTDVTSDTPFSSAIYNLVEEGIINGYANEDGTSVFKPDATITRAEFSKVLSMAREGADALFSQTTVNFPDMTGSEWAIPYVAHASGLGIVKGYEDGTFGPKNPVTYAEVVTMIVRALGYEPVVDKTLTPWYEGYIKMGSQIGVTKEAGGLPNNGASRGLVAKLCNNMLSCKKLVQTGTDALGNPTYETSDKDIILGADEEEEEGILTAVFGNSLRGTDDTLTKSQVKIDGIIYTIADNLRSMDFSSYLGRNVKFTYTGDTRYTITSIKASGSAQELVISDSQLYSADLAEIRYYEQPGKSVKATSVSLDSDLYVVYNGVGVPKASITASFASTYMNSLPSGEIKLVNNDNDSAYDIAYIDSYKTFFVNAPSTSNGVTTIYDKFGFETKLDINEDDAVVSKISSVGGSAVSATLSGIYTKNVVSVAVPLTQTYGTKVIISSATVSGEVGTMTDDYEYVEIGGKEYTVAPYFKRLVAQDAATYGFDVGANVKCYLDYQGRIICTEVSETTDPYGYLVNVNPGSGLDSKVWLRIFTDKGKWLEVKAAEKVRVDGSSMGADMLPSYLTASAALINANKGAAYTTNATYAQLVKYRTGTKDGETLLTDIYTVAGVGEGSIKPYEYAPVSGNAKAPYSNCTDKVKYYSSGYTFKDNADKTQFTTNSSTIVFVVPGDRTDDTKFKKRTYTGFSDKSSYFAEPYEVAAGTTSAKVVVHYLEAGVTTTNTVKAATPVYIVTDIKGATNDEGTTCHKVTFRKLGDAEDTKTAYLTPDLTMMSGISRGDVVKFTRNGTEIEEIKLVYSLSGSTLYEKDGTTVAASNVSKWAYDGKDDYYHAVTGTIYTKELDDAGKGALSVVPDFVVDNGDGTFSLTNDNFMSYSVTESTPYYLYENNELVNKTSGELIGALGNNNPETATKVVMIVLNKVVQGIIYIK